MLYFNTRPALQWLSNEEKGILFEAILNYGELEVVPEFEGLLGMAWSFIQPLLDRDAASYETTVKKRRYAGYCKSCKEKGVEPLSMDTWEQTICNQAVAHGSKCNPIRKTTTYTNSMSIPDSMGIAAGKGFGENPNDKTIEPDFETLRQRQIDLLRSCE